MPASLDRSQSLLDPQGGSYQTVAHSPACPRMSGFRLREMMLVQVPPLRGHHSTDVFLVTPTSTWIEVRNSACGAPLQPPAILPQLCWPFNRRFPLDFLSIPMYHMPQGSIAALYVPFSCRRLPSSGQSLASARSEERNKAPLEKGADTNDSEPIPFECDETFACQLSTEVLRTSGGLPTAPRAPAALLLLHSPYCRFSSVRKHRVQICIRRISPSIMTRFLCTLDLNWRFVFFLERGTVLPNWAPLPQILHFAIDLTSNSLIFVHNEVMLL